MSEIKDDQNPSNAEIIEKVKTTIQENPSGLNLMKKGDYSVHVLIEEIKKIVTKSNRRPRPRVKITCLNQCKRLSDPDEEDDVQEPEHSVYPAGRYNCGEDGNLIKEE